ncbi:hypothetical protein EMIHUDRAFT_196507 [Emiliania huxleyi CCMP1516]|uniref:POP1 C-terminal domain-containing protein n=2 Tax=Emiliania huxleyi TaxID=2903 RepID=A0A0D3J480_EMIH1|nr:hypothetical protein EMIHUDRAFT_196507 [Emiliania huxleyi CCMP1516]EOD18315.1 hypothetical protein EMIHUDRAFT_196507 [Emiliania huxleyi CCMP1516]|eukprot:XP_005770744.1 hypothetical protein EMIHUDRAFT_196507 [Emiliania huxleyi CCMP1516]
MVCVSLELHGRGCPKAPAAIREPTVLQAAQWAAGRNRQTGAVDAPASMESSAEGNNGEDASLEGRLLGFVTNGSYDRLRGRGAAVGFCAASSLHDLLSARPELRAGGAVLVAVRNPTSLTPRLALATVAA